MNCRVVLMLLALTSAGLPGKQAFIETKLALPTLPEFKPAPKITNLNRINTNTPLHKNRSGFFPANATGHPTPAQGTH